METRGIVKKQEVAKLESEYTAFAVFEANTAGRSEREWKVSMRFVT